MARFNRLSRALPLVTAVLFAHAPLAASVDAPATCDRCPQILDDIQARLAQRCDQVPERSLLRREPIYLFLSIYDQVSQGIDPAISRQVYQAALDGMECDNLSAGVARANAVGKQLYRTAAE